MLIVLTVAQPNTGVLQSLVALLREVRNTVIAIVDPWNNLMQSPCVTFVFSPWHVCLFMLKLLLLPNKTSRAKLIIALPQVYAYFACTFVSLWIQKVVLCLCSSFQFPIHSVFLSLKVSINIELVLLYKLVCVLTCSLTRKTKFSIYNTKIGFHPQKEYNNEQKENYIFKNAKNMWIFIE